jgi:hypothetical protein
MSVNQNIIKYYNKRPKKGLTKVTFQDLFTGDSELNNKLTEYATHLNNGFEYYKKEVLLKMIQGYKDIDNFALQFIKLNEYNKNNNPYSNTLEKFCINYGITLGTKKYNVKKIAMQGENNPFYNHGGKYSPLSNKFIGKSKKEDTISKISESNKENGNNDATLIYWLNKGFNEDEAKVKQSERQKTFSLKKCIKKYGPIEGYTVWLNRQVKWQKTLKSKTPEEIIEINRKKGSGLLNKLYKHDPKVKNTPGILYYIRFYNSEIEFWKIGITSKSINERFNKNYKLNKEIIYQNKDTFYNCYKKEQDILNKNKKFRININYNGFKTTEAFSKDIYDTI